MQWSQDRTPSKAIDTYLDCVFVKNTLVIWVQKLWGLGSVPQGRPLLFELLLGHSLYLSSDERVSLAHVLVFIPPRFTPCKLRLTSTKREGVFTCKLVIIKSHALAFRGKPKQVGRKQSTSIFFAIIKAYLLPQELFALVLRDKLSDQNDVALL